MGTSMPSFRLLKDDELDALVDYVIYLSIRGEVERKLLFEAKDLDFGEGEHLYDPSMKEKEPDEFETQLETINEIVVNVAESWDKAADQALKVVAPADDYPLAPAI